MARTIATSNDAATMMTQPSKFSSKDKDDSSIDSSDEAYQYTALPTRHTVRLTKLHSSDSGDVVPKLQMVELESVPSYEAISYVTQTSKSASHAKRVA
jgi:hypothetical protein